MNKPSEEKMKYGTLATLHYFGIAKTIGTYFSNIVNSFVRVFKLPAVLIAVLSKILGAIFFMWVNMGGNIFYKMVGTLILTARVVFEFLRCIFMPILLLVVSFIGIAYFMEVHWLVDGTPVLHGDEALVYYESLLTTKEKDLKDKILKNTNQM